MAKRKRRKDSDVPKPEVLEPTPERFQHGDEIEQVRESKGSKTGDARPYRAVSDQLDILGRKGLLQPRQYAAGYRLYQDWYTSAAQAPITSVLEFRIPGTKHMTNRQAEAFADVQKAMRAVGPAVMDIVSDVCCWNVSPAEWARKHRERGYDERHAIGILRVALDCLADHYGLPPDKRRT